MPSTSKRHLLSRIGDGWSLLRCVAFDSKWYRRQHEVQRTWGVIFPRLHYAIRGALNGLDPGPLFDTSWYHIAYPDVAASGLNPLLHYLSHGAHESRDPHPLFSTSWYLSRNRDVADAGLNPLLHFIQYGAEEERDPHPLFSIRWYRDQPGVSFGGKNPVVHYLTVGGPKGISPHPLFDGKWYLQKNQDVKAAGLDPLVHFIWSGGVEGRSPHPLFDSMRYNLHYPDVSAQKINPLVHYILYGASEPRNPNALFDTRWYLVQNPDVAASGLNPLSHFITSGASQGRDPHPGFSTSWYINTYPDVAPALINPLTHYLTAGAGEGRFPNAQADSMTFVTGKIGRAVNRYDQVGDLTAATLLRLKQEGLHAYTEYFVPHMPINAVVDHTLNTRPTINILLPSLQARHASGGPNTAYLLGCLLAKEGIAVNFVSTDHPLDNDLTNIKAHLRVLSGLDSDNMNISFKDASDRNEALPIGGHDVFLATAWWTAHIAQSAARLTSNRRIYYLIQDYEPSFYGASENYADAVATYDFSHVPIINTRLLRDHLKNQNIGRFSDDAFSAHALFFEPAVDNDHFFPTPRKLSATRRLLFYTRPTIARRNMFGLGLASLRAAVNSGLFDHGKWEFIGMGEAFDPIPLGRGHTLTPAPWLDFSAYAQQMRSADVLLSLMLSPHPSYPPLEMAACGGLTVTTTFGSKTAERLAELSPSIIGVEPDIEAIVLALTQAVLACDNPERRTSASAHLNMPRTWTESLSSVVPGLLSELSRDGVYPHRSATLGAPKSFVRTSDEVPLSPAFYPDWLRMRELAYREGSTKHLISLITTVYDTEASYLRDLAHSVLGQDTKLGFEWLILDNGSTADATRMELEAIARDSRVRLHRIEKNAGIVGGMRWCLEHATGRYVAPLDSDDLLFPDALRTIVAFLEQSGFPPLMYTNEDKIIGPSHLQPYFKPGWDPVLFVHSCYIAHLTVMDRTLALKLGCYSDARTEGCHDWDSFSRFMFAGYEPAHLPEVLYSWRIHPGSTSGNFRSKPYIYESHKVVLDRVLQSRGMIETHEVILAPVFKGTPDYRFKPRDIDRSQAPSKQGGDKIPSAALGVRWPRYALPSYITRAFLENVISTVTTNEVGVHFLSPEVKVEGDLSIEEADTLFQLFPDSVMVGGRIHDGTVILESGYVFGYGDAIGCPDVGRPLTDPGYFAQMWKPRSVAAVSARHCFVALDFLRSIVDQIPEGLSGAMFGPWLGALASVAGKRVIYSPYIEGCSHAPRFPKNEQILFASTFANLLDDNTGYAVHLGRSAGSAYESTLVESKPLPSYADWIEVLGARSKVGPVPERAGTPTVSILTTVYERTDTALFLKTAESVQNQTVRPEQWLVLAHGPIPEQLREALEGYQHDGTLTLISHGVNLGIQGGLRFCLERATGDFVLPLDADDLLVEVAVDVLKRSAAAQPEADIFYSDEDVLIGGRPAGPYYRPDFDPILAASTSYVWHAIFFRRLAGLEIGAFTNKGAEYAQDWEVLQKFALSGRLPVHIATVLYHWRQHEKSLSNSGVTFEGSSRSVQAVLEMLRLTSPNPERYAVAPAMIDVGIRDYFLKRLHVDPPTVHHLLLVEQGRSAAPLPMDYPLVGFGNAAVARGTAGLAAIREQVEAMEAEYVLVSGAGALAFGSEGLWQAIKHFEFHPDCFAVGGPILRRDGRIAVGPMVMINDRTIVGPQDGRSVRDPGFASLAAKPHRVSVLGIDNLLMRRDDLLETLVNRPADLPLRSFGVWLRQRALSKQRFPVYEPLMRLYIDTDEHLLQDDPVGLSHALRHLAKPGQKRTIDGLAGFSLHARLHS